MPLPTDPQAVGSTAVEDLLAAANQGAMRAALGLGTLATQSGTISDYLTTATASSTYVPTTRTVNGQALSGNITVAAAASTLTGTTLASGVTGSSLTSVGTLLDLTVTNPIVGSITGNAATVTTIPNLTGIVTSTGSATSIADGAIALAKLATNPLSRDNHTGTQAHTTITGLGTAAMFDVNVAANPATEEVVTTAATQTLTNKNITGLPVEFQIACSDLSSAITAGTNKAYFRAPFAFTLTAVRASVLTAPVGATILIDVNENATSLLSTKIMIDAGEKTSTTAATAPVISDSAIADDAEISIDFDQVGATIAGAGVIVTLIGTR